MGYTAKKASLNSKEVKSKDTSENKFLMYLKANEVKPMTSEQYNKARLNKYEAAY